MINRSALIVRPKQPYIDWAAQLDDLGILPQIEGEQTVYLLPEYENDVDAIEILANGFEPIFERELHNWHTDQSAWPKNRSFVMFREWFSIELHSIVEDVCGYPISDEDYP